MSFLLVLTMLVSLAVSVEASDIRAPMRYACSATRQMTDLIERAAYKFKENARIKFEMDPDFDNVFNDISLAFTILSDDVTSPVSWDMVNTFLEAVKHNEVLIAHSVLGVSVVYMIDELCLRHEIEDSVRKFDDFKQRFDELQRKWMYENRLLEDLSARLKQEPFQNKEEDVKRLDKIKTFVYEVKVLLSDIYKETLTVRQQHDKSKTHAVAAFGLGAIGAALTYLSGYDKYIHDVGKAVMLGGGGGTIYALGNMAESGKLLEDLEDLKIRAEDLYRDIDQVHAQLQRAFA